MARSRFSFPAAETSVFDFLAVYKAAESLLCPTQCGSHNEHRYFKPSVTWLVSLLYSADAVGKEGRSRCHVRINRACQPDSVRPLTRPFSNVSQPAKPPAGSAPTFYRPARGRFERFQKSLKAAIVGPKLAKWPSVATKITTETYSCMRWANGPT